MDSAFVVVDKVYMIEKNGAFSSGGRKPRFGRVGKRWSHDSLMKHLRQWERMPEAYEGARVVELSLCATSEISINEAWLRSF